MIARWDGLSWQPLGGGLYQSDISLVGSVNSMTVFDGELVAAGSFDNAGGTHVSNIARWDGAAWRPMGDGFNHGVQALAVHGDTLFAAGEFDRSGTEPAAHVDSAFWKSVGDGIPCAWTAFGGAIMTKLPKIRPTALASTVVQRCAGRSR